MRWVTVRTAIASDPASVVVGVATNWRELVKTITALKVSEPPRSWTLETQQCSRTTSSGMVIPMSSESDRCEEVVSKLRRWAEHGANNQEWDRGYNAGLKNAAVEIERVVTEGEEQ